jgi:hypothetical protein
MQIYIRNSSIKKATKIPTYITKLFLLFSYIFYLALFVNAQFCRGIIFLDI